jgi:hypothetical protein
MAKDKIMDEDCTKPVIIKGFLFILIEVTSFDFHFRKKYEA